MKSKFSTLRLQKYHIKLCDMIKITIKQIQGESIPINIFSRVMGKNIKYAKNFTLLPLISVIEEYNGFMRNLQTVHLNFMICVGRKQNGEYRMRGLMLSGDIFCLLIGCHHIIVEPVQAKNIWNLVYPYVKCMKCIMLNVKINIIPEKICRYRKVFNNEFGGGRVVRWCWVNFQCRGVLQF